MNKTVECLCENFNKDMENYLKAAFPDGDICKIMESAVYATNRMAICIFDVLLKRDGEWNELLTKKGGIRNYER